MNDPPGWHIILIAVILLLIPAGYVGTYVALVDPEGIIFFEPLNAPGETPETYLGTGHYHYGGQTAALIFWPLEQVDRRVRWRAWEELQIKLSPLQSCFGEPLTRE